MKKILIIALVVVTTNVGVASAVGDERYSYVNSDNGQHLMNSSTLAKRFLRCWALSRHAGAGHNYWTCDDRSDGARCSHPGQLSLYVFGCRTTTSSSGAVNTNCSFEVNGTVQGSLNYDPRNQDDSMAPGAAYKFTVDHSYGYCNANANTFIWYSYQAFCNTYGYCPSW
jgi:hypothetical protein